MRALVTGGAGFIGHHLVDHLLRNTDWDIVVMDRLDTSGALDRLRDIITPANKARLSFVFHDLKAAINGHVAAKIEHPDFIFHLAASTHVDRSIDDPMPFILDNVVGTANLLEWARVNDGIQRFLFFGTDEVFGPASPTDAYKEWDRYKSSNPYSASKAGAEELCVAWENTYGMPVIISHCMNCFGERQHPEKFIPKCIRTILQDGAMPIIPGSRFWIHARTVSEAAMFLLHNGLPGEKYNIVGDREIENLDMAGRIARILGRELKWRDAGKSRPGHDARYALDGSKMRDMGWMPKTSFEESLEETVLWTVKNQEWL